MIKKTTGLLFKSISYVFGALITILFVAVVAMIIMTNISGKEPEVFGYQLKTVLSGSMEPDIKTGSVIAVRGGGDMKRFGKDDVITFINEDEQLVTHRVTDKMNTKSGVVLYHTKGDNNDAIDPEPVLADNIVAEYTGVTIPYLGYFIQWTQSQNGAIFIFIPGIAFLLYGMYSVWQVVRKLEKSESKKPAVGE